MRWRRFPRSPLAFWAVKVFATTLGETGGDAVTMSMGLGYLAGTAIFAAVFIAMVLAQLRASKFRPMLYWATIVASTTVGTTLADLADRSLGLGYAGGSALLFALLLVTLGVWRRTLGTIAVDSVSDAKSGGFYWGAIMFSQTLGTALGDWTAASAGLGYTGAIAIFGGLLAAIALVYLRTHVSRVLLFWAAFIVTRPFGAVVGDFLGKPHAQGGLALSRYAASAVLLAAIGVLVWMLPQRAAKHAH